MVSGSIGRGSKGSRTGSAVQYAGSNFDEEEKANFRDKKFEGYSDLKGADLRSRKRATAQHQHKQAKDLEEEVIHNLQSQIATMETQIKLLKDQEVDQKNKASGYETLLRDGIPLNEHFLALKNKFNNEQADLKKEVELRENEINQDKEKNDQSRHRIDILKGEHADISRKFQIYKSEKEDKIKQQVIEISIIAL